MDLLKAFEMLLGMKEEFNKFDETTFSALYAMIAEEYCKEHGLDVIEFLDSILVTAKFINETIGKF